MRRLIVGLAMFASASLYGASTPLNTGSSAVHWVGKKVIGSSHNGTVKVSGGHLDFDKGQLKGGEVRVDMKSIVNEDVKDPQWNAKLVNHLKSDDFFAVDKHPESSFKITDVKKASGDSYTLKGDLTVRGITKSVSSTAELSKSGGSVDGLNAKLKFDRTLFSVKYGSGKFFDNLGDKMIADEISVEVKLKLSKPVKLSAK